MPKRQPAIPSIWLVTDARNDAALEGALARLPRASGLIFRHYHLSEAERRARFDALARLARMRGLVVVVSGTPLQAKRWRADGAYGAATTIARGPTGLLRLATAHSLREIAAASRARADALLLSPVFATRSHPGGKVLGPARFRLLASHSPVPVIALGGMNARRARGLRWPRWAAIDGICGRPKLPSSADS